MKTSIDTNILSAIWSRGPSAARIGIALDRAKATGMLILSPPVYAECLAHPIFTEAQIDLFLRDTRIAIGSPFHDNVWKFAGSRYRQYGIRRRQSQYESPRRLLVDFLVGAHAVLETDQLLTLDQNFYKINFPELRLYPLEH